MIKKVMVLVKAQREREARGGPAVGSVMTTCDVHT